MTINIREELCDLGFEESIVFDNPDYDDAIVGVTIDGNVVYDYDLMVANVVEKENVSTMDAVDYIEYNAIGSLPFAGELQPIIMYSIPEKGREAE